MKEIKRLIVEREREITLQCYLECKDYEVRKRQENDKRLNELYKLQEQLEATQK